MSPIANGHPECLVERGVDAGPFQPDAKPATYGVLLRLGGNELRRKTCRSSLAREGVDVFVTHTHVEPLGAGFGKSDFSFIRMFG